MIKVDHSKAVVWDIETDGLIPEMTRVHLITAKVVASGEPVMVFRRNADEDSIGEGLKCLMGYAKSGFLMVGHNIIKFDIVAIQKIYPWFDLPFDQVFDTLVFSRLKHSDRADRDVKLIGKGTLPPRMRGLHSLESWGYRLGKMKGEYAGDTRIEDEDERKRRKWESWNPDMEAYGVQDAEVTEALFLALKPWEYAHEAVVIEHETQRIIARQERFGVWFNEEQASGLYADWVQRRDSVVTDLAATTPGAFWRKGKEVVPKRNNRTLGYLAGAPFSPVKFEEFNPTSRRSIARFLKDRYGWTPSKFTDGGDPAIDDEVLGKLDFPEAKKLASLFLIEKRIASLSEGKQSWLKAARKGRIHGSVNTNGAVTGRMTHSKPPMAGTPKVGSPYGAECRGLFGATPGSGRRFVGADAAGLELRVLGHYMAFYDGGTYADAVVNGTSDDETDVHSLNTKAIGLVPKQMYTINGKQGKGRDFGKTFIYAYLYGAGDELIGANLGKGPGYGRKLKSMFLAQTPALKKLITAVKDKAKVSGYLKGPDGRLIPVRSQHSALNTLLQGGGAVVMKKALILLDEDLQARGWKHSEQSSNPDYEFVLNVHDEFQLEVKEEYANDAGRAAVEAIRRAGESLGFRCPLDGEFKVGATWANTH